MSDTIRYIIEALRQPGIQPGITRDPGQPVRRMAGSISDTMKSSRDDTNYRRYVSSQVAIGETPVSYEEWMQK